MAELTDEQLKEIRARYTQAEALMPCSMEAEVIAASLADIPALLDLVDSQNSDLMNYAKTIAELEAQVAELQREKERWQEAELALGDAYLRLRKKIGRAAFETPTAPTREQVWSQTEAALDALQRQLTERVVNCPKCGVVAELFPSEGDQGSE